MPLALKIEPADGVVRAYIAKHPLEFCQASIIPREISSAKRLEQELFAEPDILKVNEEFSKKMEEEVSAKAVTQIRDNSSEQNSNDGLITGAMTSFSLDSISSTTTNDITTNGPMDPLVSFSHCAEITTQYGSMPALPSAVPKPLPPSNYAEGVVFEVPFGKWSSFKWNPDFIPKLIKFDLVPSTSYRSHHDATTKDGLLELFHSAYASRSLIESRMQYNIFQHYKISTAHHFHMAHAVYCSNFIDRDGPSEEITSMLALMVFNGEKVLDVPTEYEEKERLSLLSREDKEMGLTMREVVLKRREVIQHSKALVYILNAVVNLDLPLTEGLIKETHRILVAGLDIHDKEGDRTHPWQAYAGRYRVGSEEFGTKPINFVRPSKVAPAMKKFCSDFEEEVKAAEQDKTIDPIFLAAKYCQHFIMIHPFLDGNGKTCRLILNAVLIKYMGVVIGIGGNEDERTQYLDICYRSAEEGDNLGELASLVLEKVQKVLEKMNENLGV